MIFHLLDTVGTAWKAVLNYAVAHKIVATLAALVALYGGYYAYGIYTAPVTATRYVTATVATSTVVASLTETGQVSASHQITLSPQAAGQVVGIYVQPGDEVYAGQIIAQLDATTARQSLESAELALQNAELSYQQTTATGTLALNLIVAKNNVTTATVGLQKAHDDAYAAIANIYSDLSTVVTGLNTVLYSSDSTTHANQKNIDAYTDNVSSHDTSIGIYQNSAATSYTTAYNAYTAGATAYKATNNSISNDDLIALAQSTYTTAQVVADAVRNSHDFFDRVISDYSLYNLSASPALTSLFASTNTYTATISTDLGTALSSQSSLIGAEQTLAQAQNTLQSTEGGSNTLTVQSAALSLQQAEDAVANAKTTLANYTVIAPFAGTIAAVGVQKYDQAGSGTAVATLVTNQETADISVNEVDASKIKVGQKVSLSFDALPNVTIAGTVASINSIGSVSQGVVSYSVTIGFDTSNGSVMPGMSVTANIITSTETGLTVPASALKALGTQSYVEVFDPALPGSGTVTGAVSAVAPKRVMVIAGLTDNTNSIIESGLTAGAQVVTKTIAGTASAKTTSAPSILNAAGGGARAGGGAFRALGG
ncbi:MAG TPA: efflux RND transporter periplasmic adaptor subunit [Candidatus Paceibacterota bacterium]|nr:efflux RND transporter periplasmic adaptor subunit [Candidatus Paceibacterota bacterium]